MFLYNDFLKFGRVYFVIYGRKTEKEKKRKKENDRERRRGGAGEDDGQLKVSLAGHVGHRWLILMAKGP